MVSGPSGRVGFDPIKYRLSRHTVLKHRVNCLCQVVYDLKDGYSTLGIVFEAPRDDLSQRRLRRTALFPSRVDVGLFSFPDLFDDGFCRFRVIEGIQPCQHGVHIIPLSTYQ